MQTIINKFICFQEISKVIESVEAHVAQVNSLYHKLCSDNNSNEITSFIIQLMRGKEVTVPSGSRGTAGKRIIAMFQDAQKVNITPASFQLFLPNRQSFSNLFIYIILFVG